MQISAFDVACGEFWAIQIDGHDDDGAPVSRALTQILQIAAREHDIDWQAVEAMRGQRLEHTSRVTVRGKIATVPITGPIFRYANLFTEISNATAIETTARDLQQAAENPNVNGILLAIDSPGGTVNGTNELAKAVRAAREQKPVAAYVSGAGASGAYWIASAAQRVFADETALLGSIGVVGTFVDDRRRRERLGIRDLVFVSSQSPRKRPDIDTEEGRAQLQRRVDALAQIFIEAVAENRGVSALTVATEFGQGDVLTGPEAVGVGMADAIGSYETVLADMAAGRGMGGGRPIVQIPRKDEPMTETTAAEIVAKYPKAAEALREEGAATARDQAHKAGLEEGRKAGYAEGLEKGGAEGKAEGVKAERERIDALRAAAVRGNDKLLDEAIAAGWSVAEFNAKQVALLKEQDSRAKAEIAADEAALAKALPAPSASGTGEAASAAAAPSSEGEAEKKWESDAKLRAEFGTKEAWLAYAKAEREGRVHLYSRPAA